MSKHEHGPQTTAESGVFLRHLRLGRPRRHRAMTVVPLSFAGDRGPRYLTLGEAIALGAVRVSELDEGGSVPDLTVVNQGDVGVLVLDGEELRGAKQNRVLNTSIFIGAHTRLVVPVSCTEQGRWHYSAPVFSDSGVVAERQVRRELRRTVNLSLAAGMGHRSDQGRVWEEVDGLHCRASTSSPTHAMRDVFEKRGDDLRGYLDSFPLEEGQHGLLVLRGSDVAGLDVVSRASAYACVHAKVLQSYALEALIEGNGRRYPEADEALDLAHSFIECCAATSAQSFKSPGLGWDVRFCSRAVLGSALVVREDEGGSGDSGPCSGGAPQIAVHAAFFKLDDTDRGRWDEPSGLASYLRRREYRGPVI